MKSTAKIEFGDFQTPESLCNILIQAVPNIQQYKTCIEPTCGLGNFLLSLKKQGVSNERLIGWEINSNYVEQANDTLNKNEQNYTQFVQKQDIFSVNWDKLSEKYKQPILFLGNPPWVTNSELGRLSSSNRPNKNSNIAPRGYDAISGKSNFDISEWILRKTIDCISGTNSAISFLIKTSVARRLFSYIHASKKRVQNIKLVHIDARKTFKVHVDACIFSVQGSLDLPELYECEIQDNFQSRATAHMRIVRNNIISNYEFYSKHHQIDAGSEFVWRSGIKHDAAKVMEFRYSSGKLQNGFSEHVEIPHDYIYPLLKSSHVARTRVAEPEVFVLVTQKHSGEDTEIIHRTSPETWEYLCEHKNIFDKRKSVIYNNSYPFSIFGVGNYTFLPWKVAISGMYKNIHFSVIGTYNEKPVVFDDTIYFLGFKHKEHAKFVAMLLNAEISQEFIQSLIFLDNKRPVTASILNRLHILSIAKLLGKEEQYNSLFHNQAKHTEQSVLWASFNAPH